VGAAIGAVAAGPYDAAEGAVVGAVAGGFVGAVAAAADQAQAQHAVQVHDDRGGTPYAQQAGEYRRAMSACLEGRGYSVK
jgi:outer membrane lipoprotein SlyB